MIKVMTRLFVKGVVKSAINSTIVVGVFLAGREYGKAKTK